MVFDRMIKAFRGDKRTGEGQGGNPGDLFEPYRALMQQEEADGFLIMTSDELMKRAQKSMSFNRFVQDFINETGYESRNYDPGTLEQAYRTSVYLFAFLRKSALMASSLPFIAEIKKGEVWREAKESEPINQIFAEQGRQLLYRGYMNYAIYGQAMWYMHKTRRGTLSRLRGDEEGHLYKRGGLAGYHVINDREYTLDIDYANGDIRGANLTAGLEGAGQRTYIGRNEFVYLHDFDPTDEYKGTSIASAAIHAAVTNSAIAQWASHYFRTGAMPMILVSLRNDPAISTATDMQREKSVFEQQWRGVNNSMRSVFTDRSVEVNQVGIPASEVAAPELNRTALEGIGAATGIPTDLVIPPQGGSDNARHKYLVMQAWQDTILPWGYQTAEAFARDSGLPDGMRLIINEREIDALSADREDVSRAEISIFTNGLQSFNEAREKMRMPPVRELEEFLFVNGQLKSVAQIIRESKLLDSNLLSSLMQAWNDNLFTRAQIHDMLNVPLPDGVEDGFKFQVVTDSQTGGMSTTLLKQRHEGGGGAPPEGEDSAARNEASPPETEAKGSPREIARQRGNYVPQEAAPNPEGNAIDELAPYTNRPRRQRPAVKPKAASTGEASASIIGRVSHTDELQLLQAYWVDQLPPESEVRLTPAVDFHITLAHFPVLGEEEMEDLIGALPKRINPLPLRVTGIDYFENDEAVPVFATVEVTPQAQMLQQALSELFPASSHSLNWKPHITLGYLRAGVTPPERWGNIDFTVNIIGFEVSRSSYTVVARVPVRSASALVWERLNLDRELAGGGSSPRLGGRVKSYNDAITATFTDENHPLRRTYASRITEALEYDNTPEALQVEAEAQQEAWSEGLRSIEGGVFSLKALVTLSPRIVKAVESVSRETGDWDATIEAAIRATEAGLFHEHASPDKNPIRQFLDTGDKAMQGDWESELKAWGRSAKRNPTKARERFEVIHIPPDVEGEVRAELESVDPDDDAGINAIFTKAYDRLSYKGINENDMLRWAENIAEDDKLKGLLGDDED